MKNITVSDFDSKNTLVDNFKLSGFDVVVTDVKGDRVRIVDALPELLLGNLKLKNADGHNIDPTEIVSSIDASKLGLDVAVLGGLIDGADMKGSSQKAQSDKKEDDNKRLTELLNENKKLKEELADAQQPKESPNKIEVIAEKTETIMQQYQEPPLEESVPKIYTPKKPQLILDDAGGSSVSSSQGANPSRQEGSDVTGNASTTLNDVIPLVAHLSDKSDTGVTGDNITGCNKPVFTGTTAPEAEVTLTIGGKTYSTKADVNGRWNITVSDPLPEGSNPYTVQATASNGASGTLQGGVVIDTQAQEITVSLSSASDTGVKGDFITQVTTPTFNGTAEAGARLTLAIGSSVYTFAADASGRWSFTLPEQLQDGVHQYTLTATDIAGNISTGTGSVTIDTTGPELTQQIDPSSNNMVSDDVISNSSPVFSGRTEANLIVTITIAGISYNVMADESGNWKFTVPNNLPDGAYSYTVSVTDNAGNVSSSTGQVSVLAQSDSSTLLLTGGLDTTSDTGVTGDNITGCNKPVFTGTTAPEAEVTLTIGGKTYSTKADVNGRWNITVSDPLPEGSNPYTVQATASNGASGTLQGGVVIDTQAQEITVSLSSASDTGVKGDFITQVTTPTFNGTAEAGARLTLAIGSSVYTFAADASGRWSFTLPEQLQDGVHQYTLTATDIAGNISTGTGSVTIDTTGPELTQQIDPSNQILTGNMISNVQPTFSGKTEPGVRLTISIADNTYNVIVDDTGRWSFTVPMALENKIWDYQITATDLAGNQTTLKEQIVINHQESVANIPVTGGLNISTDSGIVGDKITNFKKISFTGITEPGATINLVIADKNYTGKADEQGNWIVYVEEELQDGTYDYIVTATGSAGTTGVFNSYVTVDTCQPNANVALASGSDSGVKGDCITNITLPVLTGNTEPNTLVQINIGGVDYETISDNYGQWSVTIKSPLKEGDNIYTILVKDAAGNSSNATGILKIDTTSPSLSGIKFGDGFDDRCTNTYTPTIIGWGEAGATVDIIIGSRKHSVIVPDNRQWQFKVPKGFIAEGNKVQYITFVETDVAGNKTEQKIKFQFITEKPIINADISHSTDTDIIGDKITSNTKPILEGTVINTAQKPEQIAKAKVSVYIDGKEYNNISVDKNGHWTFQLPQELSTGNTYNYTVSVTDFVGNKNTFESYITISALSCSLDAESITGQGTNVETSNKTPTLSGTAHANSDLTVYLNNKQYTVKASVDGGWFFKITEPLGDGKYDYKVIEKTTDGKTNTFNGYFIIDTKAPTNLTVEVEDSALGNATIANRPDLTLKGKTEALALVTIAVGGITYQTKADTQGNWSYTFDKNAFIINQPYNYTVTASDAAGNKISVNGVFRVDTITVAANIDTNSNSGDKNDNITNVATPTINGETAAGAKVTLVIGGKNYTTTANSDGKWAITVDSLKDNTYNYIVTAEIDGKKNYASGSVVIDTATITPTAELDESSDTGIKHDNITNNSTPILTGQAEAGSTIKLTINGSIYTDIADAHGNWSIKITYPLWEGVNEYTLQAEDKAGNFSDILTGHIILDSKLDVPTATLVESDNSGDQSDNITNISMPSLTGLAEPGATVTIKISDHIYSTIANTDGTWTVQVTNPLNEGVNHYEVEVQDNAGNTKNITGDIVLDTTKPTLTDVKIADQIASEHDNITVQDNPVFTGKVDDITATVSICFGEGNEKHLVTVGDDGHWRYQHNSPFTLGEHQFTVEVSDKAGNTSSSTYDFEVISPEQVPVPLDEQRLPVEIEGAALSGAQVELLIDNELYSTQVDSTGKWNILTNSYTPGKYDYELKITHPSGETITDKGKVDITNKPLAIDNHHESLINTSAKVDDSAFIHSALEDVYINHQEQE